jgi:hypothetical protein
MDCYYVISCDCLYETSSLFSNAHHSALSGSEKEEIDSCKHYSICNNRIEFHRSERSIWRKQRLFPFPTRLDLKM